jgi:hypothetical protein
MTRKTADERRNYGTTILLVFFEVRDGAVPQFKPKNLVPEFRRHPQFFGVIPN